MIPRMATKLRKCNTKGCRNWINPEKNHNYYCPKCASRRFKEAHPLKYSFIKLKARAKERGHAFTITYGYYERLAIQSGYAAGKGRSADSLSLDRIDPRRGYEPGNLQVITISENSRKLNKLMFSTKMPGYLREEMISALRSPQHERCALEEAA